MRHLVPLLHVIPTPQRLEVSVVETDFDLLRLTQVKRSHWSHMVDVPALSTYSVVVPHHTRSEERFDVTQEAGKITPDYPLQGLSLLTDTFQGSTDAFVKGRAHSVRGTVGPQPLRARFTLSDTLGGLTTSTLFGSHALSMFRIVPISMLLSRLGTSAHFWLTRVSESLFSPPQVASLMVFLGAGDAPCRPVEGLSLLNVELFQWFGRLTFGALLRLRDLVHEVLALRMFCPCSPSPSTIDPMLSRLQDLLLCAAFRVCAWVDGPDDDEDEEEIEWPTQ